MRKNLFILNYYIILNNLISNKLEILLYEKIIKVIICTFRFLFSSFIILNL